MSSDSGLKFQEDDELDDFNWGETDLQMIDTGTATDSNKSEHHQTQGQFAINKPQSSLPTKHFQQNQPQSSLPTKHFQQNQPQSSLPTEPDSIQGFDEESGKEWLYPINLPLREYQFSIARHSLFQNTLVCLPTGLGKTFIAAVVMLNFYRWYPNGKVVFLAPTKPLVNQQVNACCNITAIPRSDVAEMTGATPAAKRIRLWQENRVFFLTPQVIGNDLSSGICPANEIVCCVIDEAHKALGNYAYCQVVRELVVNRVQFRVLALSATPGDDFGGIQEVINNLHIACIELRTEESIDVTPYTHERRVEKYVSKLDGVLGEIVAKFLLVLGGVVKKLYSQKAVYTDDPKRLGRFQLIKARESFRISVSGAYIGPVEGEFALGISLYHSYEQLYASGIRACYTSVTRLLTEGKSSSRLAAEIRKNSELGEIMVRMEKLVDSMHKYFLRANSIDPNLSILSFNDKSIDLTSDLASDDFFYSHPKLLKLEEVVVSHLRSAHSENNTQTRIMIFSSYRDSVEEISTMLYRHKPLVRVMSFYGHGGRPSEGKVKGFTQKEQLKVVDRFREGGYNVLVSTCVGEEGLDIGDVDLIVCFDSPKAPTRYVQRMGRTGRKREGRIVMLLTEGKEEQDYKKCQTSKKHVYKIVTEGHKHLTFCTDSPKMIPAHIHPQLRKVCLEQETLPPILPSGSKSRPKKGKSFQNFPGFSTAAFEMNKDQAYLSKVELNEWTLRYCLGQREIRRLQMRFAPFTEKREMLALKSEENSCSTNDTADKSEQLDCAKWLERQSSIQSRCVRHSLSSLCLISCVSLFDTLLIYEDAVTEFEAGLEKYMPAQPVEQSIQSGLKQLTIKTNINRHFVNPLLPRNKKKHSQIDESEKDSPNCHTTTPMKQLTDTSGEDMATKHPFTSSRTRQKIFRLESSSDEMDSDLSQPHNVKIRQLDHSNTVNQHSSPVLNHGYSPRELSQELNYSPLNYKATKDGRLSPELNLNGESVGICIDNDNGSNSDNSDNLQGRAVKRVAVNSQKPNSTFDSPLNSIFHPNTVKLLSKTSTPNTVFSNSEVIFVDDSVSPKAPVPISPLNQNPITSESFVELEDTSTSVVCGSNGRSQRKIIIDSSDSESEALNSLFKKRKFHSKRQVISSQFSPAPVPSNKPTKLPIKKRKLNSFIDYEAIESEGEYSGDSFLSPGPKNRSLSDTSNCVGNSSISHFIADTSASTGCNESNVYARYVRDLISPPINPKCKLVIDPKRHKILAHAGNNILKFKERDFDLAENIYSLDDFEAEEVFGDIDEEREREDFESLAKCHKRKFRTPFKQPQTSVILIDDSTELAVKSNKQKNGDISFSLGMDDWMEESNLVEMKENSKPIITEKNMQPSFVADKPRQKGSFSLGMEDWWDDIDPGELETDFLSNNVQNIPPKTPTPTPISPPHKLVATSTPTPTPLSLPHKLVATSTPMLIPSAIDIPSDIPTLNHPSPINPGIIPSIDSFSSTFKSHLYNTTSRHSVSMTSSQNDNSSPIIIFADTREVSSSHILSSLRIKHNISVHVFSLKQCSFLVSSRLAVDRQNISDLSQPNSTQRVIERARSMCEFYERCSIIIEKDRVKPKLQDANKTNAFSRNQLFLTNVARLSKSRLSVLFSGSEESTVDILVALARQEAKRGHKIIGSLSLVDTPLFRFFNCIPKVSPTIALKLVTCFSNANQLSSISPGELKKQCHGITVEQINSIRKFFSHQFRSTALNQYKTKS